MADTVGRYRLRGVLGVGSFATVHRALDTHLDDTVVVKILAENHSLNPEIRERFIGEGRSLRRVRSPHVIAIHDIGETDRQQPYLVLQYADRGTLAERVASLRGRGWTPGPADVLAIARSLAAAVEAVHGAGLVHRDLSPGNVLLTTEPAPSGTTATPVTGETLRPGEETAEVVAPGERLVVADLGMCKDLALHSGLTVAGGTAGFRPPEQDGPGIIDTRADLWAMSALVLWMCGADQDHTGSLPPELFQVLRRGIAADPADRHPDVGSWLADVEASLRPASPQGAPPATAPLAASAPAVPGRRSGPRGRRSRRALVLTAVLALLGAVTFTAGWWLADHPPPSRTAQAAIAIDGPDELRVGAEGVFTADLQGITTWVWALPTGEYVVDQPSVSLMPSSPGTARVELRARAPDGTELRTVHRLTVTD